MLLLWLLSFQPMQPRRRCVRMPGSLRMQLRTHPEVCAYVRTKGVIRTSFGWRAGRTQPEGHSLINITRSQAVSGDLIHGP